MKKKRVMTNSEDHLYKIAMMGHGIKEGIVDWQQIGKNAVHVAKESLAGTCGECGRPRHFDPQDFKKESK